MVVVPGGWMEMTVLDWLCSVMPWAKSRGQAEAYPPAPRACSCRRQWLFHRLQYSDGIGQGILGDGGQGRGNEQQGAKGLHEKVTHWQTQGHGGCFRRNTKTSAVFVALGSRAAAASANGDPLLWDGRFDDAFGGFLLQPQLSTSRGNVVPFFQP